MTTQRRFPRIARAVTLIELIVVMSILALMGGIAMPALHFARAKARSFVGMTQQRQVVGAVNLFAQDNDDRYPPSIAKVGFNSLWNWSDPTKLAGSDLRTPGLHRSVSAYLQTYLPKAKVLYCPSSPFQYKVLQQAWDAGDDWDNPETPVEPDVLGGTYGLYWNYVGWLGPGRPVFSGPQGPASTAPAYSRLLISDYFGFNPWRTPGALASCEPFPRCEVVPDTALLPPYWSRRPEDGALPRVTLHAGYIDGHVAAYGPEAAIPLRVIKLRPEMVPYGDDEPGPGVFYLPGDSP